MGFEILINTHSAQKSKVGNLLEAGRTFPATGKSQGFFPPDFQQNKYSGKGDVPVTAWE